MRIGIDIDDTISDTTKSIREKAILFDKEYVHGKGILDKTKDIPNCFDWTKEDIQLFFEKVFDKEALYFIPRDGVQESLNEIRKQGNDIIIISSRNEQQMTNPYEKTKEWLEKNNIPYDKLLVDIRYKGPVIEAEKIDIFIDDSIGQCTFVADNYKDVDVILYGKETNNLEYPKITRIDNWYDIAKYILNS